MGYLPIILALLGFIFLWAIVNYNSIKIKKAEVEQASKQVFQYASLRNTIIKRMANIVHEDNTLQKIVAKVCDQLNELSIEAASTEDKIQAEKKVTQAVKDIPEGYVKNSPYSEAYHQLQLAQNNYQKAASVYHKRLQEYHELINKYPSKMVAKASGFKHVQ
ncbi:hypothetical protein WJR50_05885 [Catalinimonas sp. 4WD22]|uniref:hypothetical protein n=1 Tax=Catalinimonas locisalis TaxID=3133978 RepID=UPI003101B3A0